MNTIIQIKRSTVTAAPGSLANGQLAYSYSSDKLFIGNTAGTGVIEIGGRWYANVAVGGFDKANSATLTATGAFDKANTAQTTGVAAFDKANTATATATGAFDKANTASDTATGAFAKANAALPAAGGTVSGDLTVSGNIVVSGTQSYVNTVRLDIGDNILTLNADLPAATAPSENAGIEVNRGSSTNVNILWNETLDKWQLFDTSVYRTLATNTDIEITNAFVAAAFSQANTAQTTGVAAFDKANTAYTTSQAAFDQGNSAFSLAQAAFAQANASSGGAAWDTANAAFDKANTANSIAVGAFDKANLAATFANNINSVSSGILSVQYGGTGGNSLGVNGVLYGNGTSAIKYTSAATEGKVLQGDSSGVPVFADIDGGTF